MAAPLNSRQSEYVVYVCPECGQQSTYKDARAFQYCACLGNEAGGWRVTAYVPLAVVPKEVDRAAS